MANTIETGIGQVNYGKQTAKGAIATAATTTVGYNRLKHTGGGLKAGKTLNNEDYSDGNRFSNASAWVDKVGGDVGSLTLQAQPENIGLFYAQILGSDIVTGASDPYTHTITVSNTGAAWGTWWQVLGSTIGPEKQVYYDSKIAKLTQSSPRDRNAVHLDLEIKAMKAAEVFTTLPAKTEDTSDPYLLTEAVGALTFDGTVVQEIEDSVVEVDCGTEVFWGDSIEPLQLIEKKGIITRSIEAIVTDDTLGKYRKALYNSATPAGATRPGAVVFAPSIVQTWTRSASRTVTITTPKVNIDPSDFDEMAPQPEGGKKTIKFGGQCVKSGASAPITVVVLAADATAW